LILHLEDNQLIHVISLEWAQEVWIALAVIHHTLDISSKLDVKEMFNTFNYELTKMKRVTSDQVPTYLGQVACSGYTVSENDLVARLLQSVK
jgi:hypothetical protein